MEREIEKDPRKKKSRREGQLIKRGDSYSVRIYLFETPDGKKKYFNSTVRGTRKDAERHLNELLHRKHKGVLTDQLSNRRFGEFIEDYFNNVSNSKLRTRMIDLSKVRLYIAPALGHLKLKNIRSFHIESLYKELRERVSAKTSRPLSGTTRNHVHRVLSRVFSYAIKRRLINVNPLTGVLIPKIDSKEMKTLSQVDVIRFLSIFDGKKDIKSNRLVNRVGCLFHLAVETGLRPEEYFALKWSDLEEGNSEKGISSVMRIQRVAIRINNRRKVFFDEPKTHSSKRSIPISFELKRRLNAHKLDVEKWKGSAKEWNDNDLIFPNNKGEPLYNDAIRRLFKVSLTSVGIDATKYRLYDLRHTCASLLLKANVHPKVVSERMGHSSVAITLDVYSHCAPSMQSDATNSLVKMLYKS